MSDEAVEEAHHFANDNHGVLNGWLRPSGTVDVITEPNIQVAVELAMSRAGSVTARPAELTGRVDFRFGQTPSEGVRVTP